MYARLSIKAALMCGAALVIAMPAAAQNIEDDVILLDEIELGKSKRDIQTDKAESETVINEEELKDRQASTIAELVDSVPGVTLINGASPVGSAINIRGFGATSSFGSDQKVNILVDGASVGSEELYRIGTQLFTDPALYKEVSVLRGMGGSYEYGSGAVGGTVLLDSIDASDMTGGEVGFRFRQTLQYGSNGDGLVSSSILAWQPTQHFEVLGNYIYRDQGEMEDGDGNTIGNSDFDTPSWMVKAKGTFGNDGDQSLTFSYSDTNSKQTDVPYNAFEAGTDLFGNVDREYHTQTASLTYNWNPLDNDLVDLSVQLTYANQEIDQSYVTGSSFMEADPAFGPVIVALGNADQQYENTKLTIKNQSLFSTGVASHTLRYGIEFSHRERADNETASAFGGTDERVSLFVVDEIDFGNGLIVTPGLRYEDQTLKSDSVSNPGTYDNSELMGGISAFYGMANGWGIFGSAGYTVSMPILDDLNTPAFMTQPEKARNYELGFSYANNEVFAAADSLAFKVTAYKTYLWDVTSYSGVTDVDVEGLELEARYALGSGFYADLNANIQRGKENNGTQYRDEIPADSARLTLGKRFGDKIDLSYELVASAAQDKVNTSSATPGYSVHNLRATFRPELGFLRGSEIRVGIENITDKLYTPHLATRVAPGRNFKLTWAKTF